jgi:hypothetical protein
MEPGRRSAGICVGSRASRDAYFDVAVDAHTGDPETLLHWHPSAIGSIPAVLKCLRPAVHLPRIAEPGTSPAATSC